MSLDSVIELFFDLNTGIVGRGEDRHERPHKPVLLLAALEQMDQGAETERVAWSPALRASFKRMFEVVRQRDDRANPDLPFFHLQSDGFWVPCVVEAGVRRQLGKPPRVRDEGVVYAELAPELVAVLADRQQRQRLRDALVSRYFPAQRDALFARVPVAAEPPQPYAGDLSEQPGRSTAFRKKILEIYEHKCAACGLQVRLMEPALSLVEAAHLHPFSESRNDHPTNGLALCRNHHWAMDHALIAPAPEGVWRSSRRLIPHRSGGEKELAALDGVRVLPPREAAYRPSRPGMQYRLEKMLAAQG